MPGGGMTSDYIQHLTGGQGDLPSGFGKPAAPAAPAPPDQSQLNASASASGGAQTVQNNSDKFAIQSVTPQQTMSTAQNLAGAAQGGAVNSATMAARSSGLSPAMSALVGANAGSSVYQNVLPQAYGTAGQLGLGEQGLQQNWNLGQAGINVQQQQVGVQQQQQQSGFWGGLLSGAASLASIFIERGSDSLSSTRKYQGGADVTGPIGTVTATTQNPLIAALTGNKGTMSKDLGDLSSSFQKQGQSAADQAGEDAAQKANSTVQNALANIRTIGGYARGSDGVDAIVGENGPERVILPEGSMVIPNIKDGYDMLRYVVKKAARGEPAKTPRGVSIGKDNIQAASLSMIDALNDKLDKTMSYLAKMRR